MTEFVEHQKVKRPIDPFIPRKDWKWSHGEVIRVYSNYGTEFGDYPELYDVKWDSGIVGKAFLPHGLFADY